MPYLENMWFDSYFDINKHVLSCHVFAIHSLCCQFVFRYNIGHKYLDKFQKFLVYICGNVMKIFYLESKTVFVFFFKDYCAIMSLYSLVLTMFMKTWLICITAHSVVGYTNVFAAHFDKTSCIKLFRSLIFQTSTKQRNFSHLMHVILLA